jgi:hypothetical protein
MPHLSSTSLGEKNRKKTNRKTKVTAKRKVQPFYNEPRIVESFSDVPARFEKEELYIVQKAGKRKWLLLMCPNNCGKRLELNLMKSKQPYWKITIQKNKISVYPSIIAESCGAHFWIKQSEIVWAKSQASSVEKEIQRDHFEE